VAVDLTLIDGDRRELEMGTRAHSELRESVLGIPIWWWI